MGLRNAMSGLQINYDTNKEEYIEKISQQIGAIDKSLMSMPIQSLPARIRLIFDATKAPMKNI